MSKYTKRRNLQQNFKTIESELYCYHEMKKILEDERDDIINGTVFQDIHVTNSGHSDTTANKGIRLASIELLETARRIRAIEKAIEVLSGNVESRVKLRLLEMKYFECKYTDKGIAIELNLGLDKNGSPGRTFYRYRREVIELIAQQLGWQI